MNEKSHYRHVFSIQETDCQVYHVCGAQDAVSPISSLLCPNGTLYNQQYFVCDWWFNVDCSVVSRYLNLAVRQKYKNIHAIFAEKTC